MGGAIALWLATWTSCAEDPGTSAAPGGDGGLGPAPVEGPAYVVDCNTLCDAMVARSCDDEACAPSCVSANETAGSCADALAAYVHCLAVNIDSIPTCYDYPASCESDYLAWAGCVATQTGTCGPLKCDEVAEGSCSCWAVCEAGIVRETCTEGSDGAHQCTCAVDDTTVNSCPTAPASCAFFAGCCSSFL